MTTPEQRFQRLVARLDYQMFVVTAVADDEVSGCLVGFATQCSIHPPRFLVCISVRNHTFGVAKRSPVIAVHALDHDDHALAQHFGGETGDEVDKFADVQWSLGPAGVPVLDDVDTWFAGRVVARHEFGDHVGFVLEPIDAHPSGRPDLSYQDVKDIQPGHAP